MRRTLTAVVPTEETAQVGSKRLSASEARARIEAGGGGVTLVKKVVSRRSVTVGDLLPANGGNMAPPPERQFFGQGDEGRLAHESAIVKYSNDHLGAKARQVVLACALLCGIGQEWVGFGGARGGGAGAVRRVLTARVARAAKDRRWRENE